VLKKICLAAGLCACLAPAWAANVLVNPTLESPANATGWVGFGGTPAITASTEQAHGGTQAALVSGRSATTVGIAQTITSLLQAGKGHDVRVWVRNRQAVSASYSFGIKLVDGAGTKYVVLDSRTVPAGKWVKLGGYYKHSPTGTVSLAQVYLNGPAVGTDFFIDDARLDPPEAYVPTGGADSDFIRASGRQLVVGAANTPIRLLGTNFAAYGDESDVIDSVLKSREFDREDYAAVRAAGLNAVRLNVWYRMFEDNASPYVYKQEGWDWLNKQIVWARQGGVRVLLSMMAPQCGYQGSGYTGTFWTSGNAYGSCQDRLKALWTEIASRYNDEPVIAGFDLMNETLPANNAQYQAYVQTLAGAIRAVNTRHLLDVQSCFASDCAVPPLIADSNVMYDFHHYDHWYHASQLSYGGNLGDSNMRYGDATSMVLPWSWDTTAGTLLENPPIPTGTTAWTHYTGSPFTISASNVIAAVPVFIATANTGKVTFDDFTVTEYDPAGNLVRVVQNIDMEKAPANPYLLETFDPYLSFTSKTTTQRLSGTTGSRVIESTGHRGSASVSISGAKGKYLVKMPNLAFSVRQGYKYQISGWIKGTSATGSTGAMGLQLQTHKAYVTRTPYTKAFLEASLLEYGFQFSLNNNVPINVGEFGQNPRNFTADRGGLAWMADTLSLMAQYGASGMNWNWHSVSWGAYTNLYGYPDVANLNQPLIDLFKAQGIAVY
jgi:endoglucanase